MCGVLGDGFNDRAVLGERVGDEGFGFCKNSG